MRLGQRLRASFSRGFGGAGAEVTSTSLGRSHSRSAPAPGARLLYPPASARVAVTSALSARSRILKHLRNVGWRGLLPSTSPGSIAPPPHPLLRFIKEKKKFVFSTLNNDFHWGGWDALGARVMIVV